MKELQLWADPGGNEEKLTGAFADIEETAANCRFRDCSHESEPGCAVRAALEVGELDAGHYGNYLKMKRELNYLERRQDERLQKEEVMKFVKVYRDAKAKKQMNRGEYRER